MDDSTTPSKLSELIIDARISFSGMTITRHLVLQLSKEAPPAVVQLSSTTSPHLLVGAAKIRRKVITPAFDLDQLAADRGTSRTCTSAPFPFRRRLSHLVPQWRCKLEVPTGSVSHRCECLQANNAEVWLQVARWGSNMSRYGGHGPH